MAKNDFALRSGAVMDAGSAWEPMRKSARWSGAVSAQVLWAPSTPSARVVITDYIVSATTAGKVTVFEESDTEENLCFEIDATDKGGASMPHLRTPIRTTGGARVRLTTDGGAGTVTVYGYEERDA